MDTELRKLAKRNLLKLLARKEEELEAAITVGEYWHIKCEIDAIYQQLKTYYNGDTN